VRKSQAAAIGRGPCYNADSDSNRLEGWPLRLDNYRKQILEVPAIRDLPPELKSRVSMILLWIAHEADVAAGEDIYSQGAQDEDTGCVLVSGTVEISWADKPPKTVAAPEILGEMKQFTRDRERTATVRAIEDVSILTFYWHDLIALSQEVIGSDQQPTIRDVITQLAGERLLEGRA
jgi:CRP-like cAMP-binding protein